jgi:hypothetical protein
MAASAGERVKNSSAYGGGCGGNMEENGVWGGTQQKKISVV